MSDLDEKLRRAESTGGRARATIAKLELRWGSSFEYNPKRLPEMIFVNAPSGKEVWTRLEGQGNGKDAVYERIE